MFSKKSRKTHQVKKFLILAACVLFTTALLFALNSKIFKANRIDITLNKLSCVTVSEVKNNLPLVNQNIFTLSSDEILGQLGDKYPCIKQVFIHRLLPNNINLEFVGREAALSFRPTDLQEASISAVLNQLSQKVSTQSTQATGSVTEQTTNQFLVDSDGVVFATTSEMVYVPSILFWDNNLKVGDRLEQREISNLLSVFDKLKVFNLPITEVKIYPSRVLIISSTTTIIFDLNKDIQNQLAALQLILDKAKIDEENMVFIDLRFDNPVVKYAPRSK